MAGKSVIDYSNFISGIFENLVSTTGKDANQVALLTRVNATAEWLRELLGRTEVLWLFNANSIYTKDKQGNDILETLTLVKAFWKEFTKNLQYQASHMRQVEGTSDILATLQNVYSSVVVQLLDSIGYVQSVLGKKKGSAIQDIYKFRINPTSAKWDFRKLQKKTNYGYGIYDLEPYGEEMIKLSLNNTTGFLMPPEPLKTLGIFDIMLTEGYQKLKELENYYLNSGQRLFLYFFRTFYYGWLTDLSYSFDANNPFQIKFSLGFELHPYIRIPLWGKPQAYIGTKFNLPKVSFTLSDCVYETFLG
jgi:hypothetical protein